MSPTQAKYLGWLGPICLYLHNLIIYRSIVMKLEAYFGGDMTMKMETRWREIYLGCLPSWVDQSSRYFTIFTEIILKFL